jgi:hypothetical protein
MLDVSSTLPKRTHDVAGPTHPRPGPHCSHRAGPGVPCKLHITPGGRQMQRGRPVLVLGCLISTMPEEELYDVHMTMTGRYRLLQFA